MEDHQRHDDQPGSPAEQHRGDRQTGGQGLLRPAELDRDLVLVVEAGTSGHEGGQPQHRVHADDRTDADPDDRHPRHRRPHPHHDALGKRHVDHQADGDLVDVTGRLRPGDGLHTRHLAHQLTQDERRKQLQGDVDEHGGVHVHATVTATHQQQHQQRGREDTDEVRGGRTDDRAGDVAARDRCERHRGLHGRRHQAQEEDALVELVADGVLQRHQRQADQREDHEGERQDQQVEPPVRQTVEGLAGGQTGTVEEEQQRDGDLHDPVHDIGEPVAGGENERHNDSQDDEHDQQIGSVSQDAVNEVSHGETDYPWRWSDQSASARSPGTPPPGSEGTDEGYPPSHGRSVPALVPSSHNEETGNAHIRSPNRPGSGAVGRTMPAMSRSPSSSRRNSRCRK